MSKSSVPVRRLRDEVPVVAAIGAVLSVLVWWNGADNFTLNILATTFLFAGLATAWNIIGGYGGQFSLCNGVFFAEGAYLTANMVVHGGVSPWFSLIPSALLAAATAAVISWPAFRLRGPFFAIATMTFSEFVYVLANYFDGLTGGAQGMRVPYRSGWGEHDLSRPGRLRLVDACIFRHLRSRQLVSAAE